MANDQEILRKALVYLIEHGERVHEDGAWWRKVATRNLPDALGETRERLEVAISGPAGEDVFGTDYDPNGVRCLYLRDDLARTLAAKADLDGD